MKKKYLLILILLLTVGFASINTVLDLKGNVSIGFKEDDFNVKISKVVIDEGNTPVVLSEDKQSFTFTGTGSNKIEYTITNRSYQYDANINIMCEPSANIVINQVGEVVAQSKKSETIESNNTGVITCRMDINKISKTEIAEDMCTYEEGKTWEFDYTGSEQEFVVPCDGEYKIELWGASGSTYSNKSSYGAYTSGLIYLTINKNLYLYVGQKGTSFTGTSQIRTYNGGGSGNFWCIKEKPTSAVNIAGGGATDIRLINGSWNSFDSLKSRIMVASGGGSSTGFAAGGAGGGITGYNGNPDSRVSGNYSGTGASQTKGGSTNGGFGFGGIASYSGNYCSYNDGAGGGSGYYGGGGSRGTTKNTAGTGAGGSSFISGHNGCNAIEESSTSSKITHTGQPNHYSGYVFMDTKMIDGNGYSWTNVRGLYTGMPSHDGLSTMTGNKGHGYAKITYLG